MKPYEMKANRKVHWTEVGPRTPGFTETHRRCQEEWATCTLQMTKPKFGEVIDLPKVPQWKSVDLNWVSR